MDDNTRKEQIEICDKTIEFLSELSVKISLYDPKCAAKRYALTRKIMWEYRRKSMFDFDS